MSEVKPEVVEYAAKLKKGITFKKDGTPEVEEGLYEKNADADVRQFLPEELNSVLPEGSAVQIKKAFQKYDSSLFIPGALKAVGDSSIDVMKKNAEVNQTSVTIPMIGKDSLNISFQRERQIPNPNGEGTNTKFGSVSVKFDMYSVGSRGQLLKVKQELSEKATAAFGG